jgi:hypothetical protein
VYTFFLIGIISKQHASRKKERPTAVDVLDMDGMGNQGRVPTKESKNRA